MENSIMLAHINGKNNQKQSVEEHCKNVSLLCKRYASSIEAAHIGELQGLLHDAGKLSTAFQHYILGNSNKHRGDIDHSFAGAKYLCETANKINEKKYQKISRLISHTILSHHGIHDWINTNFQDYFRERLKKEENYEEVCKNLKNILEDNVLYSLLEQADSEYQILEKKIYSLCNRNQEIYAFYLGMLERFFQSVLIDADRTDTSDFMSESQTEKNEATKQFWTEMEERIQKKYTEFAKKTDKISIRRCHISDRCAEFAEHPVKACRLIVPTGGGKTLSSLRFAIKYCRLHGKRRILYVAPFMSILEQNSDEIKAIAGENWFTEHHSDFFSELNNDEALHEYELRTEKWDAPVIATTMVQFLNTLFSAKSSAVRRMHRLADTVIIIDEIQSLPLKCVHLFNLAINFLTHISGTTVVLCSATQPAMEQTDYPLLIDSQNSMTGDTTDDFTLFHRTEVIPSIVSHGYSDEEAADFCKKRFDEHGNLLIIVNTKSAAGKLFTQIKHICSEVPVIYLSTNLCPAHRKEKISEMKKLLEQKLPVICVTTQLIEAGVDISFRCVIRSLAGLDNAAQAAGRCNRNGESESACPVYLIKLKEENVSRLEGVQLAQQITQQILDMPSYTDYLSDEVQRCYFQTLYQRAKNKLSYPVSADGINMTLLNLLSLNKYRFGMTKLPKCERFTCQAFQTAGKLFQVIDDRHTKNVIVPYNKEAQQMIEELDSAHSPEQYRELLRKAQRYTVSIYNRTSQTLQENYALHQLCSGAVALAPGFYDHECGIITEGAEQELLLF